MEAGKESLEMDLGSDCYAGRAPVFLEGRNLAERMDDARSVARLCSAYGVSEAVALEPTDEALALIDEAQERALRKAHSSFTEIGATGHAERSARELGS
jgi:hypothetical protein